MSWLTDLKVGDKVMCFNGTPPVIFEVEKITLNFIYVSGGLMFLTTIAKAVGTRGVLKPLKEK